MSVDLNQSPDTPIAFKSSSIQFMLASFGSCCCFCCTAIVVLSNFVPYFMTAYHAIIFTVYFFGRIQFNRFIQILLHVYFRTMIFRNNWLHICFQWITSQSVFMWNWLFVSFSFVLIIIIARSISNENAVTVVNVYRYYCLFSIFALQARVFVYYNSLIIL